MIYKVREGDRIVTEFPNLSNLEQRESLEEENRQVHQTNSSTIARLQELENTSSQLQVRPN